ncbi:COA8 family protein CG14806, mitochondrial [Leguminivora glycinivorella]|uniref:COA8 family protein CG14806, mitochondrial n=1 Tax=Leguminivora glycinivorella TaxID=1035111 RepID=UPI00200EFB49|nr:COA8 family protein CG14806, mitochondrial [Leguminivora glycinivorella]
MLSSRIYLRNSFLLLTSRNTSTTNEAKSMQTPNPTKINCDMVGPPDPVSNLRKVIYKQPANETDLEKRYRELRMEVQKWNQNFWTQHNSRFFQEREDYLKKNLPEGKQNLTADEMSVFYKAYLDKNWKAHITYNIEWYKKNITLLSLAIQVKLRRLFRLKSNK